ncbi:MAG TPA: hypothetical protein VH227_04480 [Candidatus Udaeobacter sp.]|jgi:hypothetical protein|nr:hypothetical protein [Candidatus Udaeobacter sp.]
MIPASPSITEENRAPNLLPVAFVLTVILWIVATTGGHKLFVKEVLGDAYDSQAEHFLRGNVDVDTAASRWETIIVNGKPRIYFGSFPAFVRIPLNYVYPIGRGAWSRLCGFCAGIVGLAAFSGLLRMALLSSSLSMRWRKWVGSACLAGLVLGSPLLFLVGSPTIYNEAILWGFASSLAALYFALRSREADGTVLTGSVLGFSFCAGAALLSRPTFGAPFLLIAPMLAFCVFRRRPTRNLAALFLPLGAAFIFYLILTYARFGEFSGMPLRYSTNPEQRDFAIKHGLFHLQRVPYSFADYFFLRSPELQNNFPFVRVMWRYFNHPNLYVMPFSETHLSILWSSSWVLLGASIGVILLVRRPSTDWLDRGIAIALLGQVIIILSFMGLAQRYTAEIFPFLIFCFIVFLRKSGMVLIHMRYAILALVALSIIINTLATAFWLARDTNLPIETRTFWNLGQNSK